MSVKKWIPWNWFKKEEEEAGRSVPVERTPGHEQAYTLGSTIKQFHREVERLFNQAFRGCDFISAGFNRPLLPRVNGGMLKPTLDLGVTDNDYTIAVEIPGVDEKGVKLEIVNDTLTIQGEKNQESEQKGKNYYRVERSFGSFQRVLSLPEDADQERVNATFKNGVLKVTVPRKALPQAKVKQIEVKSL